mmetsp:Transcript_9528/g.14561  ORF Transcript_9528/g.14561 Transcript_9528/m.14561 type:complete len:95 (+) Transcript_9528:634-918(+)
MIREHHREGRQAIKEYTKYSDRVAILSPAYTKAWKDEVVLDHHRQLKASSKEDSLVLFFNPFKSTSSSYESYQDRNLDQSKNFIVSSSKRAKRN